jgi:hypothetical protein
MKNSKYELLLFILEEEKTILSSTDSTKQSERLAEIHEIKKGFYPCEVEAVYEFLKESPDTDLIKKKYAEYCQLQSDRKRKRIKEYLKRLNDELTRSQKSKRLQQEKQEDELLNFILWCIFSRDRTLIYMITEDLFLSSVMAMIADDKENTIRIRI